MTSDRRATSLRTISDYLAAWANRGIELLWLLVVVLVPLVFLDRDYILSELELAYVDLPKVAVLRTLVGLMAVLWLLEWGLQGRLSIELLDIRSRLRPREWLGGLTRRLRGQPNRWIILAVALYLGSTILSTVLSTSFSVSAWGLVPGQDTYPAYTIVAYIVLFGAVATHLRRQDQLWRLMGALVLMGLLAGGYSISQQQGFRILGRRESNSDSSYLPPFRRSRRPRAGIDRQ